MFPYSVSAASANTCFLVNTSVHTETANTEKKTMDTLKLKKLGVDSGASLLLLQQVLQLKGYSSHCVISIAAA